MAADPIGPAWSPVWVTGERVLRLKLRMLLHVTYIYVCIYSIYIIPQVLYYAGQLYHRQLWESRMSLVQYPPSNGVASLRIQSVRMSDAGMYLCDVKTPSDWSSSGLGLINLTVLSESWSGDVLLPVLAEAKCLSL